MSRFPLPPAAVFATLAALLPLLGLYAPKALVAVSVVAALLVALDRAALAAFLRDLRMPFAGALAVLLIWAAVSSLWSPNPERALRLAFSLLAIGLGGLLLVAGARTLTAEGQRRVQTGLIAGGLLFVLLALLEGVTGGAILRLLRGEVAIEALSRGGAILAILLPLFSFVAAHRVNARAGFAVAALGLIALLLLPMFAAFVAGVAAVLAALVVGAALRAGGRGLAIAGAGLILLAPWLAHWFADPAMVTAAVPGLPTNWLHRFHMWTFASERIFDRPLLGWGLDAARMLPGGERMAGLQSVLPLHPHNAALQVWVELGLPGALLMALSFLLVCRQLAGTGWPRAALAAAAASIAAWFAIAHLSFGIWQNWWLVLPWLAAALFTAAVPRHNGSS